MDELIQTLQATLDETNTKIAALEEQIAAIEEQQAALDAERAPLDSELEQYNKVKDDLEINIANLEDQIGAEDYDDGSDIDEPYDGEADEEINDEVQEGSEDIEEEPEA